MKERTYNMLMQHKPFMCFKAAGGFHTKTREGQQTKVTKNVRLYLYMNRKTLFP